MSYVFCFIMVISDKITAKIWFWVQPRQLTSVLPTKSHWIEKKVSLKINPEQSPKNVNCNYRLMKLDQDSTMLNFFWILQLNHSSIGWAIWQIFSIRQPLSESQKMYRHGNHFLLWFTFSSSACKWDTVSWCCSWTKSRFFLRQCIRKLGTMGKTHHTIEKKPNTSFCFGCCIVHNPTWRRFDERRKTDFQSRPQTDIESHPTFH